MNAWRILAGILAVFLTAGMALANDVAVTIAAEAAGEGYTGMYLVANTIRNRAIQQRKTPQEIVKQPGQYFGNTAPNRQKCYAAVRKEADYLAANILRLPDKTNGALYFRQPREKRQKWHKVETIRYKNHIFYK
jgi:spore germination cell wall hydrolase CwlJ-like protein